MKRIVNFKKFRLNEIDTFNETINVILDVSGSIE